MTPFSRTGSSLARPGRGHGHLASCAFAPESTERAHLRVDGRARKQSWTKHRLIGGKRCRGVAALAQPRAFRHLLLHQRRDHDDQRRQHSNPRSKVAKPSGVARARQSTKGRGFQSGAVRCSLALPRQRADASHRCDRPQLSAQGRSRPHQVCPGRCLSDRPVGGARDVRPPHPCRPRT